MASLERVRPDFLCFNVRQNAVMMGVGSLGNSLIQDSCLANYGLNIVAGFDIKPEKVGQQVCGVPIYDISELKERLGALKAEIGIIAVPIEHAREVSDLLVGDGIKALRNFSPFRITAPEGIVIQNTSIYAHLAVMYTRLGLSKALKAEK